MTPAIAALGPSAAWSLTRSTGVVAMVLLSLSVILGVIDVQRHSSPRWPRFVVDSLHRNVSLLVLVFLGLHILTSAIDTFAPIPVLDSVVPFVGSYRPLWLGLGALSLDLLLAVAVTSVAHRRIGHRVWRLTHWLAYAAWPVALLHGLGTGSDTKSTWMLALSALCVLAVAAAIAARATRGWPRDRVRRGAGLVLTGSFVLGLGLWLPGGPLGPGWARRSGTPVTLLAAGAPAPVAGRVAGARARAFERPFTAHLAGAATQRAGPGPGLVAVHLAATFGAAGRLNIEIDGQSAGANGVAMSASRVTLGTRTVPELYTGRLTSLAGGSLSALVTRSDGRALTLRVNMAIDAASHLVSGTVIASPAASGVGR